MSTSSDTKHAQMHKHLNTLLKHVDTVTKQHGVKYKVTYFAENESIEIYFKSQFNKKYNKDFIQVNEYGLHYWNSYNENYNTLSLAEMRLIINIVFI